MPYEFKLPDIGEGLHEAEIVRWFVKEGDVVKADDVIAEIQTDKAVVEMTTPVGGKIVSLAGDEGTVVRVGETLIALEQKNDQTAVNPDQREQKDHRSAKRRVIAAPIVRKKARELGIDLTKVEGSEKGGRITLSDLEQFLRSQDGGKADVDGKRGKTPATAHAERRDSADERVAVKGLRKRIAEKMVQSSFTAPHVTGMDEIDVSKLVRLRKQLVEQMEEDVKLTYLPFIVKAVTKALKAFPYFNASYDEERQEIVLKKRYNIGIATATKQGLVVPVIKQADQKTILEIAREVEELTKKAHEQKLELSDLQDGTFTITSTGAGGGWFATPIINYPEVAIFGAHAIKKRPVVVDDEIVIRDMMGVSITFDHRVIDGEPAGRFMQTVATVLENPERLLLDVK